MKLKLFLFFILSFLVINVYADDGEITSKCTVTINGEEYPKITDTKYKSYVDAEKDEVLKISCEENISHLYIYYNVKSTTGTINDKVKIGKNKYLHELIELDGNNKELTIKYDDDYSIADIFLFNTNTLPDWVEQWESLDRCDLMLFSTHADDEQLFFAGLMPTYIDKGYSIQVVYFTNHYNNTNRYHELLEGLWTIGVKYYPVVSSFPDGWAESLEEAITFLEESGYTRDDALKFEVEQIRRFRPLVVVGHDENGEYSHGQHILNTNVLEEAITKTNDKSFDEASYKKYGGWEISKLYLHLYEKGKIVLNYDVPLDSFGGKTAYEVSKLGFAKHYSQQYTWFTAWLNGDDDNKYTKATQIKEYNPAYYGLYYSSVGEDSGKNDMFENISKRRSSIDIVNKTKDVMLKITKGKSKNEMMNLGITLIFISIIGFSYILGRRHK